MLLKTVLNKVEHFKSFVFGKAQFSTVNGFETLVIDITPRKNGKPECSECGRRCKVHDLLPERLFEYVPFLTFKFFFRYAPRRVKCPACGIKVEAMPWAYGKERMTISYQVYLARWARRLSWQE